MIQLAKSQLILAAEEYINNFFKENIGQEYTFHNYKHTQEVVGAAIELGLDAEISAEEMEILQVAAWFHDTGFDKGEEGHEERSAYYAEAWLSKMGYSKPNIQLVIQCILDTKPNKFPRHVLSKLLCDADFAYMSNKDYPQVIEDKLSEVIFSEGEEISQQEWLKEELFLIENHHFHTESAEKLWEKRKIKNIKWLRGECQKIQTQQTFSLEEIDNLEGRKRNYLFPRQNHLSDLIDNNVNIYANDPIPTPISNNKIEKKEALNELLEEDLPSVRQHSYKVQLDLGKSAEVKSNNLLIISFTCVFLGFLILFTGVQDKFFLKGLIGIGMIATSLVSIYFTFLAMQINLAEKFLAIEKNKNMEESQKLQSTSEALVIKFRYLMISQNLLLFGAIISAIGLLFLQVLK